MSSLAYSARVKMHSAAWGDETGSVVTFKLPMSKGAEAVRNPFHDFTKRRKGRSGTRFLMVCHTAGEGLRHALYEDEVMLAGWNDSQQNGHTVKFWICNDAMGHPFEGVSRKEELLISLVELDDDNETIDQKMRDRVEGQKIKPSMRLSYAAVMLCKNSQFWQWASINTQGPAVVTDEETAKAWLCAYLCIKSRAELNTNEEKAEMFHESIRKPFNDWLGDIPF